MLNYDSKSLTYNFDAHFDINSWMPVVFTIFNENKLEIMCRNIYFSYYEYLSVLRQLNYDSKSLRYHFYAHFDKRSLGFPITISIFGQDDLILSNMSA